MWGRTTIGSEVPVPGRAESMARKELADANIIPEDVELADLVSEQDTELFRRGLSNMGIGDRMVKKMRTLDKLAESGGKFLSTSLHMTHRMYIVQLVRLYEQTDWLVETLEKDRSETEAKLKLSPFDRSMYLKMYVEMVKEAGRGYKITLEGTEAMVRMMVAARDAGRGGGKARKPGWGMAKEPAAAQPEAAHA